MKKRMINLFAALLTILMLAAPVHAAAAPKTGEQLTVPYDTDLRAGPGESYRVAASLNAGETVEYTGIEMTDTQNETWYAVNFGKKVVWINSRVFDGAAPEATAVPTPEPAVESTAIPTAEPTPVPTAEPLVMAENSIGRYMGSYAVDASSYRKGNNPAVYGSCAVDSDLVSAWNTHDAINGEWLRISVKDGQKYQIAGVRIANGYWKNSNVYTENSRMKEFDVYCDGMYVTSGCLEDAKDFQTVWFDQPVTGSTLKIVVSSAYRGSLYRDLCITEIDLLGPGGRQLVPELLGDWGAAVRAAEEKARSGRIEKGSRGMAVAGLQLLLRDGFGVLEGTVDGAFGNGTKAAVQELAGRMEEALPYCEPMTDGVVDRAFWRNMVEYMRTLG